MRTVKFDNTIFWKNLQARTSTVKDSYIVVLRMLLLKFIERKDSWAYIKEYFLRGLG